MERPQLIPHLFRKEYSKIVSVLCKTFGIANIQLAEDIASETFLVATETWSLKGLPDNPQAWLYAVAKNKTRDVLKRQSLFQEKIAPQVRDNNTKADEFELDLSEKNIEDSQLKMLFTVCNPVLSTEAQISLALRVLCGFGIEEIANALLSSKSTVNKRLQRAKNNYRKYNIQLDLPPKDQMLERQQNVLTVIYLLFNEGYYSSTTETNIRKNLCVEAMRLLYLFLDFYDLPKANAMMALFCFHASRFEARADELGAPILYEDQDMQKWDQELIYKGEQYLQRSAVGQEVSRYHLEATIAFWHTRPDDNQEKWETILQLYNHLLQLEYSPMAALNRTYALARANGKTAALEEALKINLQGHPLYHSLLAELYQEADQEQAIIQLERALDLVKTNSEKEMLQQKLAAIKTAKNTE